jgi:hypothetical protein
MRDRARVHVALRYDLLYMKTDFALRHNQPPAMDSCWSNVPNFKAELLSDTVYVGNTWRLTSAPPYIL